MQRGNRGRFGHLTGMIPMALAVLAVTALPVLAVPPVVKTVQFVPDQPTSRHPIWCDTVTVLKGTSDQAGSYTWDPADGSGALYSATVDDTSKYKIGAKHTYTTANGCAVGRIYAAKLTVTNGGGESAQKIYYLEVFNKNLTTEVNRAIDEGLWALHTGMSRWDNGGIQYGDWHTWNGYYAVQGANVEAFFSMGFKESGSAENPYTETVQRAMNRFFELLSSMNIGVQALGNPDSNSNGIGLTVAQGYRGYQTGVMLAALVASNNPTGVAQTGPSNVNGRSYLDIAKDIADWIAWAQYDNNLYGGWRYEYNEWPDNSACQWNAIGLISAERQWGIPIPAWVKSANVNWLTYSHSGAGNYGYTDTGVVWGPLATTGSGLVQAVMDGLGRGDGHWDSAESYLRNTWDTNPGNGPMKYHYLYALFSFSKSMLLHTPALTMLHSSDVTKPDLNWYSAETSLGDPSDGLARALVNGQNLNTGSPGDGRWWNGAGCCWQPDSNHYAFATAWAVMMLNRTVIQTGRPVAIAKAIPLQAVAGQTITLDGGGSYHQAVGRNIVKWDWTLYNGADQASGVKGTKSGRTQTTSYPAMGNYLVKLTVTDDATPPATADDFVTVLATVPPLAPVANAGGPYRFCKQATPWVLNGSRSYNPDEGQHEPGNYPGDSITAYNWDLTNSGLFDDAIGVKPDATNYFWNWAPGTYLIQLQVTDNTALSFPDAFTPPKNLNGTATANVTLDGDCPCVADLAAKVMSARVDLSWRHVGAEKYNIYRKNGSSAWSLIGSTTAPVSVYTDTPVTNGVTYSYEIRPFRSDATPNEYCESNIVNATPVAVRPPR